MSKKLKRLEYPKHVEIISTRALKPLELCRYDGCGERAQFKAELVLRGSPVRGATTIRVCERHKRAAKEFILNDANRTRLAIHMADEIGICDYTTAEGMVKHNADVEFLEIAS